MATLTITSGPGQGHQGHKVGSDRDLVIGREDADVVVDDSEMSRRHAANFEVAVLIGVRRFVLLRFLMRPGVRDQNHRSGRRRKVIFVCDSAGHRAGVAAIHQSDGSGARALSNLNSLFQQVNAIRLGGLQIAFAAL